MPALASVSAAEEPAGPDPTTATRKPKTILQFFLTEWAFMGFDRITPVLTLLEKGGYVTELKHSFTSCMGSVFIRFIEMSPANELRANPGNPLKWVENR